MIHHVHGFKTVLFRLSFRLSATPIKIPTKFFVEIDMLKFTQKCKGTRIVKYSNQKKYSNQNNVKLTWRQTGRSIGHTRESLNGPTKSRQRWKGSLGEKETVFQQMVLEWLTSPISYHLKKLTLVKNYKFKTINILDGNIGEHLHDFGFGKDFWDNIPKTQSIKEKNDKLMRKFS